MSLFLQEELSSRQMILSSLISQNPLLLGRTTSDVPLSQNPKALCSSHGPFVPSCPLNTYAPQENRLNPHQASTVTLMPVISKAVSSPETLMSLGCWIALDGCLAGPKS